MPKSLRESVLFNNRFEAPEDSDLNKAAVLVNGSLSAGVALVDAPSEPAPTSALCRGPSW